MNGSPCAPRSEAESFREHRPGACAPLGRQCLADTVREGGNIVTWRTVVASLLPVPELSLPLRLFLSKENFDSSAISHVGPKALFLLDTSD